MDRTLIHNPFNAIVFPTPQFNHMRWASELGLPNLSTMPVEQVIIVVYQILDLRRQIHGSCISGLCPYLSQLG